MKVLAVGQDGDGLESEEVAVPDADERHDERQVFLRRRGAEVLVHVMEAREEFAKAGGPDRDHRRESDGRVHRVAATDPVPKAEHVVGVDAELGNLGAIGRDGDEVFGDRGWILEFLEAPSAGGLRVGHRL